MSAPFRSDPDDEEDDIIPSSFRSESGLIAPLPRKNNRQPARLRGRLAETLCAEIAKS